MKNKSIKTYIGLIITLAFFAGVSVFLFSSQLLPIEDLPASKPILALINVGVMLIVYGGLGLLGLKLSKRIGFAEIWDLRVSNKQRFVVPAIVGSLLGLFFIVVDLFLNQFHSLGRLPHPDFPLSFVASITAGIGEEIMFRLFFVSFWVWFISYLILKDRFRNQIFWIVSVASALTFSVGHIPSVMAILGMTSVDQIPSAMMGEIFILNGVLSLVVVKYFRKYGLLAAIGIHFWTDIVWHVVYGSFVK